MRFILEEAATTTAAAATTTTTSTTSTSTSTSTTSNNNNKTKTIAFYIPSNMRFEIYDKWHVYKWSWMIGKYRLAAWWQENITKLDAKDFSGGRAFGMINQLIPFVFQQPTKKPFGGWIIFNLTNEFFPNQPWTQGCRPKTIFVFNSARHCTSLFGGFEH